MRSKIALILTLPVALAAAYFAVAESGEVVVLEHGEPKVQTRLWVVDFGGAAYLRGKQGRGWAVSVESFPKVRLRRSEAWTDFVAEPATAMLRDYEAAVLEKYGFSERIRGLSRGGGSPVIFRLVPVAEDNS